MERASVIPLREVGADKKGQRPQLADLADIQAAAANKPGGPPVAAPNAVPPPAAPESAERIAGGTATPAKAAKLAVSTLTAAPTSAAPVGATAPVTFNFVSANGRAVSAAATNTSDDALYFSADGNLRQWFFQVDTRAELRKNPNSPPVPKVLTKFQLERTGDAVTITDEDGSVYRGQVVATPADKDADRAAPTPRKTDDLSLAGELAKNKAITQTEATPQLKGAREVKALADSEAKSAERAKAELPQEAQVRSNFANYGFAVAGAVPQPAAAVVYFRASGTNVSLKQSVLFDGNLLFDSEPAQNLDAAAPAQNAAAALAVTKLQAGPAGGGGGGFGQAQTQSLGGRAISLTNAAGTLSNTRVQGVVRVGGKTEFELRAVPVQK
jgi:hypothetical protein